ncbi:MAG: bleomycin resistance family protein [Planctomycetes bacterium]|nr:bleomycin resistance family protein [Planctomycetota bacterium]
MYKKLTTNMMVENVNSTVDFYGDVLGFEFVMGVPENSQEIVAARHNNQPLSFAIMKCGNVEMMFQTKKSMAEEIPKFSGIQIGGSMTFYIDVEDVKGLYAKLKDKVTIIKDMHATFYGKQEFYIRDCNGYILTFSGAI